MKTEIFVNINYKSPLNITIVLTDKIRGSPECELHLECSLDQSDTI